MATASSTSPGSRQPDGERPGYECACGQVLRVRGNGRHRVFYDTATTSLDDPILNRVCPACGRELPGKGLPYDAAPPTADARSRS